MSTYDKSLNRNIVNTVAMSTFSSKAKEAESLVNGGASIIYSPSNSYIVFKWISDNILNSLSIDVIRQAIINISNLYFKDGSTIKGISDGFIKTPSGGTVQIYDQNIALSCAFGYKIQTESDHTSSRLNIEIERRQLDYSTLLDKFKETDANAKHAESMIHYIDFDLDNHQLNIIIPVEDPTGKLSYGDMLPADTIYYGEIVPGEYNPNVGINDMPRSNYIDKLITTFNKDGIIVNGSIAGVKFLTNDIQTVIENDVTINGNMILNNGTITGITTTIDPEVLSDTIVPSISATCNYISQVVLELMTVIAADFDAKQKLIEYNANNIDGIKNSHGGYDEETFEYSIDSKTWPMWVYIKKWILKALQDSINGSNPPEWEENVPSVLALVQSYGFDKRYLDYVSLNTGSMATDPYIKIGHEETPTRRDICNVRIEGSNTGGLLVGKDSSSGVYSYNWLVVHGYYTYKNDVALLCEGTARFENSVSFTGSTTGINYNDITNRPELYTKSDVDNITNDIRTTYDNEILSLRNDIKLLNDKVEQLLTTIKDMSTYEDILFRLIDIMKDVQNLNTTCNNLNNRIIALESSKADIDAVKQNVVDLQTWEASAKQELISLDDRVKALEGK